MSEKQKQTHPEVGEDATQYGEFVSTYFAWVPLPKQKENAEKMANMTKGDKEVCDKIREKKDRSPITKEESDGI